MPNALILLLLFCLFPITAHATTPLILKDNLQSYSVKFDILEDKTGLLTINDVRKPDIAQRFIPVKITSVNYGFTKSVYWVKLEISNQATEIDKWYLRLHFPNMQNIDFCIPDLKNTAFTCKKTGTYTPFSSRDIAYPHFIFKLPLKTSETKIFYFRFQSEAAMSIGFTVNSLDKLMLETWQDTLIFGLYFGYLLIAILYNFFLWLSFKERSYLYYILFILCLGLYQLAYEGLASKYLWWNYPQFNHYAVPFFLVTYPLFSIAFAVNFLKSKQYTPWLHKLAILEVIFLLVLLLMLFLTTYAVVISILSLLTLIIQITLLIISLIVMYKGYQPARYFVLGWTPLLVLILILIMMRFNWLPTNEITEYFQHTNLVNLAISAIMATFLSLALADKINLIKQERENALQKNNQLILEQNLLLETQVKERTLELEYAKEKSEIANQAKSTFIANMSHELRSPLNAIIGFSQVMLRTKNLPQEQYENAGIIYRSGDYLLTLINNILDFSKIEAGKTTLNKKDFDLYQLLNDLKSVLNTRIHSLDLELIFDIDNNLPRYLYADSAKLRQVLLNLLGNAIKFTQQGEVILTITASPLKTGSDNLCLDFSVRDTGAGIAKNELQQLFTAFSQTDSGRHAQEGTGLGLVELLA